MTMSQRPRPLSVGRCGGGLGGLTAAIALARAGANVTVLEAAAELGEIGPGIQNDSQRRAIPLEMRRQ